MSKPIQSAVAKAFVALLGELKLDAVAWHENGKDVRAGELLEDARLGAPRVVRYVQDLMTLMHEMLLQPVPAQLRHAFKPALDVTARPREAFIAVFRHLPADHVVYKTMSHYFTAGEMASLLEAGHSDALSFASDSLRVARDVLARRHS